jgi:hypothetical protein
MARRQRERQKVIRGRVPSDARKTKSRSFLPSQLSERSFAARERSIRALWDIRQGTSPSQAARDNEVTTRTIRKYVGAALLQDRPGGRIRATKSDRYVRYLQIPGPHGPIEITARGSKEASEVARYKSAVNRFLRGERNALAEWHGKRIAGVELVTAERTLKSLADRDLLPYSLYRSFSGGAE